MRKTIDQLPINNEIDAEAELSPRVLRPSNPNAPQNVSFYSLRENQFLVQGTSSNLILHVLKNGTLVKESHGTPVANPSPTSNLETKPLSTLRNLSLNQFEFNERGCETINPIVVSGSVSTHPPPSTNHSGSVTRSIIEDSSVHEPVGSRRQTDAGSTDDTSTVRDEAVRQGVEFDLVEKQIVKSEIEPVYSPEMEVSGMQMERIITFNCEQRVYQDLVQVFSSESDDIVMNALWKFSNNRTKNKSVTAIKWNPQFPDLFAVGFGSFDYAHHFQGSTNSDGFVAIYTLKNVNCPQRMIPCNSVCSVDWHPTRPCLLAVGMYDGNVGVVDISSEEKNFAFYSGEDNVDHSDPVWELRWVNDSTMVAFDSVSSNGCVMRWHVARSNLESECVMKLSRGESESGKPPSLVGSFTGICLDFGDEDLFIGTEEGPILKCSQSLQSTSLFPGHPMAVYAVKRNPFDGRIFATCSADWTVKIWHTESPNSPPLCTFETSSAGAAIGDLAWSPVVSTMFAIVNGDGCIAVFDINKNRSAAILSKKILKKGKLTRISFNKAGKLVLVGDERGTLYSFKIEYGSMRGNEADTLGNVVEILKNSSTNT